MMSSASWFLIQKSYEDLLSCIQPSKILPHLFQEEVFSLDDMEEVNAESTRKKQVVKLLELLLRSKNERALPAFMEALQNSYPHLAQQMRCNASGSHNQGNNDGRMNHVDALQMDGLPSSNSSMEWD